MRPQGTQRGSPQGTQRGSPQVQGLPPRYSEGLRVLKGAPPRVLRGAQGTPRGSPQADVLSGTVLDLPFITDGSVDPYTGAQHWRNETSWVRPAPPHRRLPPAAPRSVPSHPTLLGTSQRYGTNCARARMRRQAAVRRARAIFAKRDAAAPLPRLHRDCQCAHPGHVCAGTGLTPATSAPGLGSPPPHRHRDWASPRHVCTGTGLTLATSAPGLGSHL